MSLHLRSLSKRYGGTVAVSGVDLAIERGRTLALLGPSGCGKSTLLRLIAGLERPDSGSITLAGTDITGLAPQKRAFGVVFQDFALFPHLNVARNVAFGLVEQRRDRAASAARVAALLDMVGLAAMGERRVHQLSGGQQQRVALARALAPEPAVLLLDEPLSNLDENLRQGLSVEIRDVLDRVHNYAVYVTHDQVEAFSIAEQVAVMRAGVIAQVGTRDELLDQPRDAWVARFLGHENVWEGEKARRVAEWVGVRLEAGDALLLRSDLVRLADQEPSRTGVEASVTRVEQRGLQWSLELAVARWATSIHWSGYAREFGSPPAVGDRFTLAVPPGAWRRLADATPTVAPDAYTDSTVTADRG
jgi:ABC-type Fe3+/spermidine/putrescine transport system ATPase subunit